MTFDEAQRFLYGFVNWEAKGGRPTDPSDLERFEGFLRRLGSPHRAFPSIWVVGTNGKGSTCAMLSSILRRAGMRVGLYTSPHLVSVTERIQVDGRPIAEEAFADGVARLAAALGVRGEGLLGYRTTFELLTALAFLTFREEKVDVAVVEAGMGARLDATSVVSPVLTVVTPIHLDHTATLGRTLASIARDKAAAIRPGVPVVTAPQVPVVRGILRACVWASRPSSWVRVGVGMRWRIKGAEDGFRRVTFTDGRWRCEDAILPLRGAHQVVNAATAVAAARVVVPDLSPAVVREGLRLTCWPGRLEVHHRSPTLLLDGAHNPHGARALARFLDEWAFLAGRTRLGLVAISTGKDPRGVLEPLRAHIEDLVACAAVQGRGMPVEEVVGAARGVGFRVIGVPDPARALSCAADLTGPDGVVVATGSLYLVGAVARERGIHQLWWG